MSGFVRLLPSIVTGPRLLKMASDVYVMSRGVVVLHEKPQDLSEEALHRIYLS